jgi:hypothetical protein
MFRARRKVEPLINYGNSMAARKSSAMKAFPKAGIDLVEHELTVDMMLVDEKTKKEKLLESLLFKGRMTLRRAAPVTIDRGADKGKTKVDFEVLTWVASAYSQQLQTEILYILSEDVKQKPSSSPP